MVQRRVSPNCLQARPFASAGEIDEGHLRCTGCGCPCHNRNVPPGGFKAIALEAMRAAEERRSGGVVVEAKFEGRCAGCDGRVHVGDQLRHADAGWVHADCAEQTPAFERQVEVCDRCWLTKPCGCEDPT